MTRFLILILGLSVPVRGAKVDPADFCSKPLETLCEQFFDADKEGWTKKAAKQESDLEEAAMKVTLGKVPDDAKKIFKGKERFKDMLQLFAGDAKEKKLSFDSFKAYFDALRVRFDSKADKKVYDTVKKSYLEMAKARGASEAQLNALKKSVYQNAFEFFDDIVKQIDASNQKEADKMEERLDLLMALFRNCGLNFLSVGAFKVEGVTVLCPMEIIQMTGKRGTPVDDKTKFNLGDEAEGDSTHFTLGHEWGHVLDDMTQAKAVKARLKYMACIQKNYLPHFIRNAAGDEVKVEKMGEEILADAWATEFIATKIPQGAPAKALSYLATNYGGLVCEESAGRKQASLRNRRDRELANLDRRTHEGGSALRGLRALAREDKDKDEEPDNHPTHAARVNILLSLHPDVRKAFRCEKTFPVGVKGTEPYCRVTLE